MFLWGYRRPGVVDPVVSSRWVLGTHRGRRAQTRTGVVVRFVSTFLGGVTVSGEWHSQVETGGDPARLRYGLVLVLVVKFNLS